MFFIYFAWGFWNVGWSLHLLHISSGLAAFQMLNKARGYHSLEAEVAHGKLKVNLSSRPPGEWEEARSPLKVSEACEKGGRLRGKDSHQPRQGARGPPGHSSLARGRGQVWARAGAPQNRKGQSSDSRVQDKCNKASCSNEQTHLMLTCSHSLSFCVSRGQNWQVWQIKEQTIYEGPLILASQQG